MWVEKYRPTRLDEILDQENVVSRLKAIVKRPEEMPHLLFAGAPGTGKTTAALCLAREILGESWKDYTLELNASNERGIDTVRDRIKNFASYIDRREGIPYRILLLDESDAMCLDPTTKVTVGTIDNLDEKSLEELQVECRENFFDLPTWNVSARRFENDRGKIVPSGSAELFEVTFDNGKIVLASAEHPFFQIHGLLTNVVKTKDLIPGETEIADFGNRLLHCFACKRIFYRQYPSEIYEHYFCSTICRNIYFGSFSKNRTKEEWLEINQKSVIALRQKGTLQTAEYRRKRSEIALRLIREGKIGQFKFKFKKGEGYWAGKKLSPEHKQSIGEGTKRFFKQNPDAKKEISRKVKLSLQDENRGYRKLARSGYFKVQSKRAFLASVEYWKTNRFRSKLEQQMAGLLDSWNIAYEREHVILYSDKGNPYSLVIDFVIKDKIALFVQGCWWHVCPTCNVEAKYEKQRQNLRKDLKHFSELESKGYKVVLVWEHELKSETKVKENVLPRIFETVGISGMPSISVKHSKVVSVRSIGTRNVLNISVQNNRNFFLANGILTHNTNDAQTALRRIMEESSRTTRFILTANYSTNIIEPIQSRCAVFRFSRHAEKAVVDYLESICKKEGLTHEREALAIIYDATEGDMRHALNMLQAASVLGRIDAESVKRVSGISGRAKVAEVIETALEGDFEEARLMMIRLLQVEGISEHDFIKFANETISKSKEYASSIDAIKATAEADYRLLEGSNPEIQLSAYLAELASIGRKNPKKSRASKKQDDEPDQSKL